MTIPKLIRHAYFGSFFPPSFCPWHMRKPEKTFQVVLKVSKPWAQILDSYYKLLLFWGLKKIKLSLIISSLVLHLNIGKCKKIKTQVILLIFSSQKNEGIASQVLGRKQMIMLKQHNCFPDSHKPHKYYPAHFDPPLTLPPREVPQFI